MANVKNIFFIFLGTMMLSCLSVESTSPMKVEQINFYIIKPQGIINVPVFSKPEGLPEDSKRCTISDPALLESVIQLLQDFDFKEDVVELELDPYKYNYVCGILTGANEVYAKVDEEDIITEKDPFDGNSGLSRTLVQMCQQQ